MVLAKHAIPEVMFSFWAKSGGPTTASMHSVPHHCVDVAAVASVLLDTLRVPAVVSGRTLVALVALHDIGKFTKPFQGKVEALWPVCLGNYVPPRAGWPHDQAGYAMLLTEELAERLDPLLGGVVQSQADALLRAVTGHHGRPPPHPNGEVPQGVACRVCMELAGEFIGAVLTLFDPPPLPMLTRGEYAALAWFLAGLTTLADWIGSSRTWFPPVKASEHWDLAEYWNSIALPRARHALEVSGLKPSCPASLPGLASLFPKLDQPRPLQLWADGVTLPEGPALFVIEDATGSGKTEAALVLAQRLMVAKHGQGLYFALPTMATANAMYERLGDAYSRLFAADSRPSLVLAHGRRLLNPRFTDSILEDAGDGRPLTQDEPGDQPGTAQCAAWIADDRRKAFLAEIGVGTIDQALLAVLPSRHAMLRLVGLSQRVLIVDEAHAYDTYVGAELARLLQFHAALGGSAIVLSATLTGRQRATLGDAFRRGLGQACDQAFSVAYPLATTVSRAGVRCAPVPLADAMRRSVAVRRVATLEEAADALAAAARAGSAVAWIRNAVDDAIEAAVLLRARGLDPLLFHARFAMGDRLAIEAQLLARLGPAAPATLRAKTVLVATQVAEQSLDFDVDLMVSDLAPADLVIQRAGRLWRHKRDVRPVAGPNLLLLAPEPVADPQASWLGPALRRTGYVYPDHALLWRSARALLGTGAIVTPDNIRWLVEAAYDHEAADARPSGLEHASLRAEGKALGAAGIARLNLLDFERPYEREAGLWEPDMRTPTRLGEAQTVLRLARLEAGRVVPLVDDPDTHRAWTLSEVSVRRSRLAGVAPGATDGLVAEMKHGWPVWERDMPVMLLRMQPDGALLGDGLASTGGVVQVRYSSDRGLTLPSRGVMDQLQ